jgi:GC-rich sequence DNA-binding factor
MIFPLLTDTIESDARLVFSDVVEEFCSIRGVASRFESWRNTDAVAYREAYVSLCLPKVLGPLVRLKMLMWNPLQVNPAMTDVEMYFDNHWLDV